MTRLSALFSRLRQDSGVVLVEYALVIPIFVLVTFGMLDCGRAFNYWIDTTHLANEAARFAAVDRNPATSGTLQDWVEDQGSTDELRNGSASVPEALQICVDFLGDTEPGKGDPVRVTATATYQWMGILGLDALTTEITSTSTMRLEADPEDILENDCI